MSRDSEEYEYYYQLGSDIATALIYGVLGSTLLFALFGVGVVAYAAISTMSSNPLWIVGLTICGIATLVFLTLRNKRF